MILDVQQKLTVALKNPTNMQTFPLMSQLWTHMLFVLKSGLEATCQQQHFENTAKLYEARSEIEIIQGQYLSGTQHSTIFRIWGP